jgi:hypothetical protein
MVLIFYSIIFVIGYHEIKLFSSTKLFVGKLSFWYFYPPLPKGDFKNYADKISPYPSFPKRGIKAQL